MKIKHLETAQADLIRRNALSGTTSSGSTKHLVFHVDNVRGYALLKVPGASYSNRGTHYVSGHIDLIMLKQSHFWGRSVWETGKDKDGRLTEGKADQLVKELDAEFDSLCKPKEFRAACAADPGKPVTFLHLKIGAAYEFRGKRCLKSLLEYGDECVKSLKSCGRFADWEYISTSVAYEEELARNKADAKRREAVAFAEEWIREFDAADAEDRIELVLRLQAR